MKMYNYIVTIGCNTDNGEETIEQAKWMMRVYFPTVLFTRTLRNPAIGMGENAHDFYNALVCVRAHMTESKVKMSLLRSRNKLREMMEKEGVSL